MNLFEILLLVYLFVTLCLVQSHCIGLQFDKEYNPNNYYDRQQVEKVNAALQRLDHVPNMVHDWPDPSIKFGQVSGVAIDNAGHLLVFHRAGNVWDYNTFSLRNVYQAIGEPPIPDPTILVFNDTGDLVDKWGQDLFYMPHGITVDTSGNVWVTDVALHQVFKFTPGQRQTPALTLGEKFVPGNSEGHFCKPSAVAVLKSGDFFVADGYCNHRIIKFSPAGKVILQWGRQSGNGPFVFNVPHALTLAEDRGLVCVADRERGRVACFRHDNGTYVTGFSSWLIGTRVFSVAYSPVHGGRLYVVNGPTGEVPVRGYGIEFDSGRLALTFAPNGGFKNPHDIVVSEDGSTVYVAELDPYRVVKLVDEGLKKERQSQPNTTTRPKPTATSGK
ncbi:peptidyl-alpha-hydroxyglycine alpha-amidating lyase 1-like isoform X2 [Plodia interpunctella]|uniref:peptidyl-alpha-hydroxyglycine alpha-amidating lyase 1-like isoform X2 n=1 Tax=Plodia interpunctella TaxID=58824 RepID=UPI0023677D54|nr:peptidyl-alpha-hydroxyglycine alpha-amidating lyase 1-like isoform X2 [Plodia interpunctella]